MDDRVRFWQLFSEVDGAEAAARALDRAVRAVEGGVRARVADGHSVRDAIIALAREHIEPVRAEYAAVGAADSEPGYVMADECTRIATEVAGADVLIERWDI